MTRRTSAGRLCLLCLLLIVCRFHPAAGADARFEISYPDSLDAGPITGRVFVAISKGGSTEPRLLAGSYGANSVPLFGVDVDALRPGQSAVIDSTTPGYPPRSLDDIPAGEYDVQALLHVYTQVRRQDGHVLWVHMDQWEGQKWNRSPGNLVSAVQRVRLDPDAGFRVSLTLDKKLPPIEVPADTEWVKRVKFQSKLLSEFWGHPIYLGATLLLPRGYDQQPDRKYPAIYFQGHFSLTPPFGFSTAPRPAERPLETEAQRQTRLELQRSTGREGVAAFAQSWMSDDFPRMIAVTFQHPTPYYDDSYAVNSANNGPYGDALTQELIPYLEQHFHLVPRPEARVLTGGSTGGWEALALQIFHPKFFNGTWSLYPDPVDFRRYQIVDIYSAENAFETRLGDWKTVERPIARNPDGQVTLSMRQFSQLEAVLGSRGRSGQQLAAWEAAYGPVSPDGYPKLLWDQSTGKIDRDVAHYMRDHGYDLRHYLEQNWPQIGEDLAGKIHVAVGDEDNYYLNLAVYLLDDFLKTTKEPPARATIEYGRPLKAHGWQPWTNAELIRQMAERINTTAPGLITTR